MVRKFGKLKIRGLQAVSLLWLVSSSIDRLWIWLDRSVPSWDPADNLTNALNFLPVLQRATWSGDWWMQFWAVSSKYPPLLFALTVPFLRLFGLGEDSALLVNLLFSAILLLSVYGIGRHLLSERTGVWAATLCVVIPGFYTNRLQYFMDFPVAAMVALSFYCLTLWRDEKQAVRQWIWAIAFGISYGLAILTKQSALLFLIVPILWLLVRNIRQWKRLLQLGSSFVVTLAIVLPWVSTNWIYQISAAFNSNVKSAIDEGDPPLNTIAAWTYYWQDLPRAVSWPLLILATVGVLYGLFQRQFKLNPLSWLLIFWLGSFGLWSAVVNKDGRYILPAMPIVAIVLAHSLTVWRRSTVRLVAIGLAGLLLIGNLFPIGGMMAIAQILSPQAGLQPYMGAAFPHEQVIDTIIRTQPWQIANLGMLASTSTVNQHTFNYYGNLRNFQVFSRQMGRDRRQTEEELRSLSWFLTLRDRRATGGRRQLTEALDRSPDFRLHQAWTLPDNRRIRLYGRSTLPVTVQPIDIHQTEVKLDRVDVPLRVPPAEPIPVTYTWSGGWQQLTSGLVLLTWRSQNNQIAWIHDHGIGLGSLYAPAAAANRSFQVIERTAMQPPATPGTYRLEAVLLDGKTGEVRSIPTPAITITLDPTAPALPAPELDWVTQLRSRAADLPQGRPALEEIFGNIGQLNMFDPILAYATQAAETLAVRLQQTPMRDYAYGLALARALLQQVDPTIAALNQVVQLDSQNPNAYAYLAAANLYALHPQAAQTAIDSALAIAPHQPELHAIACVAALMRGNLWQAWQHWQQGNISEAL